MDITGSQLLRWGQPVQPVRVRPDLPPDPTSDDGRVDWVAVDRALRGQSMPLTRPELNEVCKVLDRLRREYHDSEFPIGTIDDVRSPYVVIKRLLIEAYPQFEQDWKRWRNRTSAKRCRDADQARLETTQ